MKRISWAGLSLAALAFTGCGATQSFDVKSAWNAVVGSDNPSDPNFFVLSDGTDLRQYDAARLQTRSGFGNSFDRANNYLSLKQNAKVYYVVRDLESGEIIAQSPNADKNVYGASVPKIVVAAAALEKSGGKLANEHDWKALIRLLVDSENNPAWDEMQNIAGGKDGINDFTRRMGYPIMRAGRYDGNAVNALEMSKFYYDVIHRNFVGSEVVYKIASACNTGADRSRKFLPKEVYLGGKTGTWNASNHDTRFLRYQDKMYSIVVMTELGTDANVATMFGGLFGEYIAKTLDPNNPPPPPPRQPAPNPQPAPEEPEDPDFPSDPDFPNDPDFPSDPDFPNVPDIGSFVAR